LSANKKYRHCFILGGKALIPGVFGLFKRLGKTGMSEIQKFVFLTFIKGYMPVSRPGKGIHRKKTIRPPRHADADHSSSESPGSSGLFSKTRGHRLLPGAGSQKRVSFPFFSVSVKAPDSRACVLNLALACEVIQQFDLNHYHALLHAPDEACGLRQLLDL